MSHAVERAQAHFNKVSNELMSERCRALEVALWKLANECDGMCAFEMDIKAITGTINWNVLRSRVDEARDILKAVPDDILRNAALGQQERPGYGVAVPRMPERHRGLEVLPHIIVQAARGGQRRAETRRGDHLEPSRTRTRVAVSRVAR